MDRENGKGILFGVLGIMTLIIAILGASLAYFTATARSRDDAVTVQSATVAITYTEGRIVQASNLIPATQDVAELAYAKTDGQCQDDDGDQVCAVYGFEVKNDGVKNQELKGSILTTTRCTPKEGEDSCSLKGEFDNLSYIVYETSCDSPQKVSTQLTTFAKFGGTTELFNDGADNKVVVESGKSKSYEVLIWLNELSKDIANDDGSGAQDHEQGLTYSGTVTIDVVGASDKITGEIQ